MLPERLTTRRLLLRKFQRRDASAIVEAVRASLPELQRWLPWPHPGYGREDALAFIRESHQAWREGRAYDFAIRHLDRPERHLGNISIWYTSKTQRVGEIGYWVRSDATSGGIATEAAEALLDQGFGVMRLHKITLRIAVGNRASERVAEKLGFVKEGILRQELQINGRWVDHTLYSLLEHEHALRPRSFPVPDRPID
ncbi:MAG: N-acetyltransferase [Acidimicrobiia bacterium]|jgi:ribosomal-protein-serine acetyltransferase|nr:MAG: N-acetyltransferase [Acidimicrobiia bacterium]